ncbi:MAG TPA: adenylyl-sulfate kinase [Ktedonobacteraceae bacterium]|nr:adenylyl-sulfate kinase [Ktedonobacteraceae bacterium]
MAQHSQPHVWDAWPGWSTITAHERSSFTLWFTGLAGTGKTTLADLVKKALAVRGYKVEIIAGQTLSRWLSQELHVEEQPKDDHRYGPGYDAFITYICSILARNGVITITTSVSPHQAARDFAREQLRQFIEVYLHCSEEQRYDRLHRQEQRQLAGEEHYQPPIRAELSIDTGSEAAERSALRVISYLEQSGYIAPLWETTDTQEEIALMKARLQALGYLD